MKSMCDLVPSVYVENVMLGFQVKKGNALKGLYTNGVQKFGQNRVGHPQVFNALGAVRILEITTATKNVRLMRMFGILSKQG